MSEHGEIKPPLVACLVFTSAWFYVVVAVFERNRSCPIRTLSPLPVAQEVRAHVAHRISLDLQERTAVCLLLRYL